MFIQGLFYCCYFRSIPNNRLFREAISFGLKALIGRSKIERKKRGESIVTIEIGKKAPDFVLPNQDGEDVSLSDYVGKNIVLYFYPKDMTPGCTTQACDFRDNYEEFSDYNTVVLGISPDPIEKHTKFIEKHLLPFPLLADVDHQIAEKYDVWKLKKNFGREYYGIERSTFVIDKEGIIQNIERKVRVKGHIDATLAFIQENLEG